MNNKIWNEFDKKITNLFKICNGKTVIIWGYDCSGWFLEHIFKRVNKSIDYIIDDGAKISNKLNIYRSIMLNELDVRTVMVLCTFSRTEQFIEVIKRKGLIENRNVIFVKNFLYGNSVNKTRLISYYDWLEEKYGVDIKDMVFKKDIDNAKVDNLDYSPGIDYALRDVIDHFVFDKNDAVFDFGYGKGGALLQFKNAGVGLIGGIEYAEKLRNIAISNYEQLGIETKGLLLGDAASVTEELDAYNYFFFYNPFQGETFKKVVSNIQESLRRKKRNVTIIYSGPYCHNDILEDGIFALSKQIYTDYSVRKVNIYTNVMYLFQGENFKKSC